ncbi:MAG: sugar transferase, partial [Candidatus Atribacteria bacterium]|nr:sugar transferase [Candidatus Atribacteria bacterium]
MVLGGTDIDTFTREDLCQYLRHVIKDFDLDRVVLLLSPDERQDLVSILEEEGIPYDLQSVLSFFEQKKGQVKLYFADLLDYKQIIAQNPYLTLKYLLDRIVSSIFLVVLAPLFGVIALLIFLDSPGPILYWQTRVGQGGKI